ncbi:MAG TPA: metallophosphoesterase family protein [Dehalococcoidia bacterium]|nr:metallophosphoesterase family protein [Dehalococcoidia bacterium]
MKIGLISDTHSAGSGRDLPQPVLDVFRGVDLILHSGDLECLGVLDYLETVAPVLAVRGYEDPVETGERLANATRVVEVEGVSIGMVHDIQWPTPGIWTSPDGANLHFPQPSIKDLLSKKFGRTVGVVLFGDTHEELICHYEGVLFINPGSPTFPGRRHRAGSLGTVGMLEIEKGVAQVRLIDLAHV